MYNKKNNNLFLPKLSLSFHLFLPKTNEKIRKRYKNKRVVLFLRNKKKISTIIIGLLPAKKTCLPLFFIKTFKSKNSLICKDNNKSLFINLDKFLKKIQINCDKSESNLQQKVLTNI